jgi:large subunit ribosomal protein L24
MKIKKGDNVIIRAGKDRGRKGKIIRALPQEAKVVVEGINMRKKHVRPKRSGEKGQIIELPTPVAVSAVQVICGKCQKAVRVGYAITGGKKSRVCKKCGADI